MFKWEKRDLNAPTPRADFIVCWIKDLVDLKAKQTHECLHDKDGFCCLGIASNTAGYKWIWNEFTGKFIIKVGASEHDSYLPSGLSNFLGTKTSNCEFKESYSLPRVGRFSDLIQMNDRGVNFRNIAKTIQNNCMNIFKDLTDDEERYIKTFKIPTRQELRNQAKLLKDNNNV